MDTTEARRRLASVRVARLATVSADGRPHVVPITFAVRGDTVWFAVDHKPKSTIRLRRLANIEANPMVSLLADHYDEDWERLWWVRADGVAAEVQDRGRREEGLDGLAARYAQYRVRRPEGPVVAIEVERWSCWSA